MGRAALAGAQKRAEAEGRTIVWVDESGCYLLPLAVGTWAPRGQPPIVRVTLTHDHLAAISGITLDGRLFLQIREQNYDSAAVVGFLRVRHAQDPRQAVRHLGWLTDPQGPTDQGLPEARSGQAPAAGAVAGLRT